MGILEFHIRIPDYLKLEDVFAVFRISRFRVQTLGFRGVLTDCFRILAGLVRV